MNRKEIIFFDELGFGWVVERSVLDTIHASSKDSDLIIERTLAELLRRV